VHGLSVASLAQALSVFIRRNVLAVAMLLNNKRVALWKRTSEFGDVRIGAPFIAGLVVESALKLAHAPAKGMLPKVFERQGTADHKTVDVAHIFRQGQQPGRHTLHVTGDDADLAVNIARKVAAVLQNVLGLSQSLPWTTTTKLCRSRDLAGSTATIS